MADTPDQPAAADEAPKPRRRAPRKAAEHKAEVAETPEAEPAKPARGRRRKADAPVADAAPTPAKRAKAPAKPRAAKRATPRPAARKKADEPSTVTKATEVVRHNIGRTALAGGLALAGAAATAALFSLRGSSRKPAETVPASEPGEKGPAGDPSKT